MKRSLLMYCCFLLSASLNAMDITLAESEILALENSFELHSQQLSMEVARLSYRLGIREYLPRISVTYSDSRQVKFDAPDTDNIQMGLTVNQLLFNGGRNIIQRKLASIQLNLENAGLAIKAQNLRDQVWQLYHKLTISRKKLELQKELLNLSRDQLAISVKKFELGTVTEIELIEARIKVHGLQIDIASTENQDQVLRSQFNRLIRRGPEETLNLHQEIDTSYSGLLLKEENSVALYQIAIKKNLELRNVQFEMQQAKTRYDIASRSFLPKLSIEGRVSFSGENFPLQNPSLSAALNIEFPVIPFTTRLSVSSSDRQYSSSQTHQASLLQDMSFLVNRKSASIQLSTALDKEENFRDELLLSIKDIVRQLNQKHSSLELKRKAIELQEQKLNILEAQYELGQVREIDLIKSNIEFYYQEIAIWEDILDLVLTERSLEKLIGLGLGELTLVASGL